ncbi:MAG: hypothetical protein ACJ8DJ_03365 [Gemmatimonadales bacterium]
MTVAVAKEWEPLPRTAKWQYVLRVAGYNDEIGYYAVTEHGQRVALAEHIDMLGNIGYELAGITPPRFVPTSCGGASELPEFSMHGTDYLLIFKRPIPDDPTVEHARHR